ncbi:MAG: hypothetical protein OXC91_01420 [Rhodobacteraceae bacterium]|nr:hypothetical protein [Paracoccaceae bacterium]
MTDERTNALAIARLTGEMSAIRGENAAMEARIDAGLTRMQAGVDAGLAKMQASVDASLARIDTNSAKIREDMAKRETRLLLAIAGMFGLAVTTLGLWLS